VAEHWAPLAAARLEAGGTAFSIPIFLQRNVNRIGPPPARVRPRPVAEARILA
jgi:hypothetical protein